MKNVISITLLLALLFGQTILFAQPQPESQPVAENVSFTYAEFRVGYGASSFGEGLEERYKAGNFGNSGGFLATLAAYHKFKNIQHLNFGLKYKSLGASPAKGDNGQEMFFNFWGAAVTAKYFPFDRNARKGLYLQADYFFVTQFTHKYRTKANLVFDHQFAIGNGVAFGLGYDFPIGKGKTMLTFGVEYEADSRKGEVMGIGDKNFNSANLGFLVGLKF